MTLALPLPDADAAPKRRIDRRSRVKRVNPRVKNRVPMRTLVNGVVHVDPVGKEFVSWHASLNFVEAMPKLSVRWSKNNTATDYAKWELHEKIGSKTHFVASGEVSPISTVSGKREFDIAPISFLPKFNNGPKDKVYQLRVFSRDKGKANLRPSVHATLTHKRKATGVKPPADPFKCGYRKDKHVRAVSVVIPNMTVNKTSNTPGDSGRDELYFNIARLGPGLGSSQHRTPGADDYYEAHKGANVDVFGWKNKNQKQVAAPTMYFGQLAHNQKVTLSIVAREQDNAQLKSIKQGVITALHGVAAVGTAVGGWGVVVAAAAEVVASLNEKFVPETDGHDFIGNLGVQLTNQCGRIKMDWFTYEQATVGGEIVKSEFIDPVHHDKLPGRQTVMFKSGGGLSGFSPTGWDYGNYTLTGDHDAFFWKLSGTSGSRYTFVVLAQTNVLPSSRGRGG